MKMVQISEMAAFDAEKATKVALADGDHCRVTLWCLDGGQAIRPHTHAGDHVWVVQEGSGWFLQGEEASPVGPGSVVFAPAGEVHGMRAQGRLVFVSVTAG